MRTATWTKWDDQWAIRVTGEQPAAEDGQTTIVLEVAKKSGETSEVTIWATPEWTRDDVAVYHLTSTDWGKGHRAYCQAENFIYRNGSYFAA